MSQSLSNKWLFQKNTRSKLHSNYHGFVKSRVGWSTAWVIRCAFFFRSLGRKGGPTSAFSKTMEIENGTKNNTNIKSSALGPSKNGPWERLWTNMKKCLGNECFFFWWSKTIGKYWITIYLFSVFGHSRKWWKNDAKGDLGSHVLESKMATWASQVRLILWFWTFSCDAEKS